MEKFYITTPIYYPNGKFHIGTAYTTLIADVLARYKRLKGYDVRFLTGTDEHGEKIALKAEELSKTPKEYVDEMASIAKKLWEKMDITNDDYIQTTESRHEECVKKIYNKFLEDGDIYLGKYSGLYCVPCESFFTENQLIDGKCPDCGREVKVVEEESYFFKMNKYQDRLLEYYEKQVDFINPSFKKTEMINNFIKPGLEDLSITRTSFDWGIQTPNDPKHVLYVWVDALSNYISALGYLSEDETLFKKYWPADVQIIGKDILRFHAIYWPIFLMALDLPLPKKIYVHEFIMMKDGKMSKSKGNVIYPEMLIDRYGLDASKYSLIKSMPYGSDGEFTPEFFIERYNTELCNDLGNLLNRTIAMINKYNAGFIDSKNIENTEFDEELENYTIEMTKKSFDLLDNFKFSDSLTQIFNIVSRSNKYIDQTMPWVLAKEAESANKLNSVLYHLVENLRITAVMLRPYIENTSFEIFKQLNIDESLRNYESIKNYGTLKETKVIDKGIPLFSRLDETEEIKYLTEKIKGTL